MTDPVPVRFPPDVLELDVRSVGVLALPLAVEIDGLLPITELLHVDQSPLRTVIRDSESAFTETGDETLKSTKRTKATKLIKAANGEIVCRHRHGGARIGQTQPVLTQLRGVATSARPPRRPRLATPAGHRRRLVADPPARNAVVRLPTLDSSPTDRCQYGERQRFSSSQLQHLDGMLLPCEIQDGGTVTLPVQALVAQQRNPAGLGQRHELGEDR